jgi:hypothetical protein
VGRPSKWASSRRYHLTLESAEADVLDAYASEQRRPVATVAARLLVQALRKATSQETDEIAVALRQVAELQRANAGLRRRLEAFGVDPLAAAKVPRWEWPLEDLFADREWWATWLPRLCELLGREARPYGLPGVEGLDHRGYVDLMTMLFPPVHQNGHIVAEWNSLAYPTQVVRGSQRDQSRKDSQVLAGSVTRAAVWEPILRHVTVALCAIEQSSVPGADPVLRIRTQDELATSWLRTLRRLTGAEPAELPGPVV